MITRRQVSDFLFKSTKQDRALIVESGLSYSKHALGHTGKHIIRFEGRPKKTDLGFAIKAVKMADTPHTDWLCEILGVLGENYDEFAVPTLGSLRINYNNLTFLLLEWATVDKPTDLRERYKLTELTIDFNKIMDATSLEIKEEGWPRRGYIICFVGLICFTIGLGMYIFVI